MKKKSFCSADKQVTSRPIKRSFKSALEEVKAQIEWQCLPRDRLAKGLELAMIIAEVELLRPDALVRIEGNDLTAELVSEIYSKLTHEHINLVLDNLAGVNYKINAIKTYMRTALYNAVFVLDTSTDNMAKTDF